MKKLLLAFLSVFAFTGVQAQCTYTLTLEDSWGDGWNGNTMDVWINGTTTTYGQTFTSGSTETHTITAAYGDSVAFIWQNGGFFTGECSFRVDDSGGNPLHQSPNGFAMIIGAVEYGTSCQAPPCDWQLTLLDSWGDGWNGNTVDLYVNGVTTSHGSLFITGSAFVIPVTINSGDSVAVIWQGGGFFASECSYELADNAGGVVYTSGSG